MPEMIREIRPSDIDVILAMSYVSEKFRDEELEKVKKICDRLGLIYEVDMSEIENSIYVLIFKDFESKELSKNLRKRANELIRRVRGRTGEDVADHGSISTQHLDKFFKIGEIEYGGKKHRFADYLVPIGIAKFRFSNHEQNKAEAKSSETFALWYQDLGSVETEGKDVPTDVKDLEMKIKSSVKRAEWTQFGEEALIDEI